MPTSCWSRRLVANSPLLPKKMTALTRFQDSTRLNFDADRAVGDTIGTRRRRRGLSLRHPGSRLDECSMSAR